MELPFFRYEVDGQSHFINLNQITHVDFPIRDGEECANLRLGDHLFVLDSRAAHDLKAQLLAFTWKVPKRGKKVETPASFG